jgi:hypothetical protein
LISPPLSTPWGGVSGGGQKMTFYWPGDFFQKEEETVQVFDRTGGKNFGPVNL